MTDEFHVPRAMPRSYNKVYLQRICSHFSHKSLHSPLCQTNEQVSFVSSSTCQISCISPPSSLLSCLPSLILECFGHEVKKDSPIYHNLPSTTGSQSQPQCYHLANPASAQAGNFKDILPRAKISPYLL